MSELSKKSPVAEAILQQLKDPFKPNLVKYAQVGGGAVISFVDARDVMKRLDDVLGPENWKESLTRTDGGYICKLSIRYDGEWHPHSDVAMDTKIASQKGAASGAFKRAAVKHGIGRYFYYFDPLKWRADNVDEWPEIFKPGAPEDWEKIAQEQFGQVGDVDGEFTEFGEEVISNVDKIRQINNREALLEFFNSLDQGQQNALQEELLKRTTAILEMEKTEAKENATKPVKE